MVGKISTRKHKQWESDGLLEVIEKNATLKVLFYYLVLIVLNLIVIHFF